MKKRLSILYIFFSLFSTEIFCQTVSYTEESKRLTTLDFYLPQEGVVIFQLKIDNHPDSLNFIFDTGCSTTFLDSTTAVDMQIHIPKTQRTARGMGGYQNIYLSKNHQLHINNLTVDSVDLYFMDIAILSFLYGKKIHGIIGNPLLKKFITKINYDTNKISFWTFGKTKFPKSGFFIKPNISNFAYYVGKITDYKEVNFNYLFDSGAALTLLFSKAYIKNQSFLHPQKNIFKKKLQGLGGEVDFELSFIKKFTFGKYNFKNIPVTIFEDENNITSYPKNGGLVGNEILRRFNAIFDYNTKIFHFVPNTHFKDPFDYAFSGLELYLIDNKIIVGDVSAKSPAEKGGFLTGDEVIAINNLFIIDLEKAKKALQSTIGKVKIIVKRNHELLDLEMKTIDIRSKKLP